WRILQSGPDEIGKDHSISPGLTRTYGIEQANNHNRKLLFLPVGKRKKFIEGFGSGVAPAAFRCGAKDKVSILVERNIGIFAVHLGGGSRNDKFFLFAGSFENELRAIDVRFDGPDRAFDNELDAHSGGQVNDHVRVIDKLGEQLTILDAVKMILEARARFEMADIFHAAGGKIVDQNNTIAAVEEPFRQMRPDEASAASDQKAQGTSSQRLRIVIVTQGHGFALRILDIAWREFPGFLRTIAIGVGVVSIRVVIIGGAGIHPVENDTQDRALHAVERVARAREGYFGSLAAANHEQHAVGLDGKNHGIRGRHNRRRIDNDELELRAQLRYGVR